MGISSPLLLVGGIMLIWLVARFGFGKRYGGPSLGGMFTREAPMAQHGLGPAALRTLLDDFKTMVAGENALRGLILAGPFASGLANARSPVTMVVLTTDFSAMSGRSWLARWPYINRGHLVLTHEEVAQPEAVIHRMTLRGAPDLVVAFVAVDAEAPPVEVAEAITEGMMVVETGTSDARTVLERWKLQKTSGKENG